MKYTKLRTNKHIIIAGKLLLALCFLIVFINVYIKITTRKSIYDNIDNLPKSHVAIVLGAKVMANGQPSNYLKERLDKSIELYNAGIIKRFLLSGDHGKKYYDEVTNMKAYLKKHTIPEKDIFLDHAGFDTYSTMKRAKKVFMVEEAIIVSQKFHLPRAVYLAHKSGIAASGIIADKQAKGNTIYLELREVFARIKAFFNVLLNRSPKFLGSPIPITADEKVL